MEIPASFHIEKFIEYRRNLAKTPFFLKLADYNWYQQPDSLDIDNMVYWMMLNEFSREISNSINRLIINTRQLRAWAIVFVELTQEEKLELLHATVNSLATAALGSPYVVRSRFYFAVAHLSHQANKFRAKGAWIDDLPLDQEINHAQAQNTAKHWPTWRKLNAKLNEISGPAFRIATDDFRNKYNHRFASNFEIGMSHGVVRLPPQILTLPFNGGTSSKKLLEQDNGRMMYAFGGNSPLLIADVATALEGECKILSASHEAFKMLVRQQMEAVTQSEP